VSPNGNDVIVDTESQRCGQNSSWSGYSGNGGLAHSSDGLNLEMSHNLINTDGSIPPLVGTYNYETDCTDLASAAAALFAGPSNQFGPVMLGTLPLPTRSAWEPGVTENPVLKITIPKGDGDQTYAIGRIHIAVRGRYRDRCRHFPASFQDEIGSADRFSPATS